MLTLCALQMLVLLLLLLFPLFSKESPLGATPLTDFEIFRGFYTPNYRTLVFQISCDSPHSLRSYC